MNSWLVYATLMLLALLPSAWVCCTAAPLERAAALQMAQILSVLVLLLLAEGFQRAIYFDVALVLAVLSLASGLVYLRYLERWL